MGETNGKFLTAARTMQGEGEPALAAAASEMVADFLSQMVDKTWEKILGTDLVREVKKNPRELPGSLQVWHERDIIHYTFIYQGEIKMKARAYYDPGGQVFKFEWEQPG